MNNAARAYAVIAVRELQRRGREITEHSLNIEMAYLMDIYSEKDVLEKINDS